MFKLSSRHRGVFRKFNNLSRATSASFATGSHPIVVKNGLIVNTEGQFHGDVHINNGIITNVSERGAVKPDSKAEIIDADGRYVIPGGIDPHVHMEMPFMGTVSIDDYNYGTRAGLAGGTTTLIDYIIPSPGQSLVEAYEAWAARAKPKVNSDYSFHCCITYWADTIPGDMEVLVKEKGITSFKIFLAYKDLFQVNDDEVLKIMQAAKKLGAMTLVHAENGDCVVTGQQRMEELGIYGPEGHSMSRNDELEAEATHRAITLAQHVGAPVYIVHVMSKLAADEVARGRRKGFIVFGEPIASGLGVDGSNMWAHDWRYAAGYVMSPPLSPDPTTKEDLMKRLAAGELQLVATDNCTFSTEQKMRGRETFTKIPNGVNGIEDRLSIVWNNGVKKGYLTPSDFVRVTSTQAAQIFNMYPRKGAIREGSDADLVIWNGDATRVISAKTHHHAVDFNIFEGMEVNGVPELTISAGQVKWRDGELQCEQGSGNYISRKPFGYAYQKVGLLDDHRNPLKRKVDRDNTPEPIEEKYKKEKARADVLAAQVTRLEKLLGEKN